MRKNEELMIENEKIKTETQDKIEMQNKEI